MPSSSTRGSFIIRPKIALIAVALFALTTVCRLVQSAPITAAASAAAGLNTNNLYNRDYSVPSYKKPAKTSMYQSGGIANKQINNQVPLQQVVVPVAASGPVPQAAAPLHPAVSQVQDLLNQVHALNGQQPQVANGAPIKLNNHVSKVSIGNTKETNINHISHSIAPITTKSVTSQDVGPKSSHVGDHHAAYHQSPVTHMHGDGNYYGGKVKTRPTEEQKELKARLLDLASKATANSPSEPVLRYNSQTGVLERVPVDPNASLYKDKLHQALGLLNPKKLPTNKLKAVLSDDDDDDSTPNDVLVFPEPEPEFEPEYMEVSEPAEEYLPLEEPAEEEAPLEPTREDIVNQVRFELDDRLNRISDLLYFRPEFMNQLLNIDDATELTPVESEFKRMVLCNSDEQFCTLSAAAAPDAEHVPEEEPVFVEQAEPSQVHVDEDVDEDLMDDDEASAASPSSMAAAPRKLARGPPGVVRSSGRPVQHQQQRRNGGYHAQQQQRPNSNRSATNSNSRYQQPQQQQQQAAAPRRAPSVVANHAVPQYVMVAPQQHQARGTMPVARVQQQQQKPQMQSYQQPQQLHQSYLRQQPQQQLQLQPQQQQPMRKPALAVRNGNNLQTLPSTMSSG